MMLQCGTRVLYVGLIKAHALKKHTPGNSIKVVKITIVELVI